MRRTICVAVSVVAAQAAFGGDYTGTTEELARFAAMWEQSRAQGNLIYGGSDAAMDIAYFQGFTAGVALSSLQLAWCPQQPFTVAQVWAIVAGYLRDHPARWNSLPQTVVGEALGQSFPCSATKKKSR